MSGSNVVQRGIVFGLLALCYTRIKSTNVRSEEDGRGQIDADKDKLRTNVQSKMTASKRLREEEDIMEDMLGGWRLHFLHLNSPLFFSHRRANTFLKVGDIVSPHQDKLCLLQADRDLAMLCFSLMCFCSASTISPPSTLLTRSGSAWIFGVRWMTFTPLATWHGMQLAAARTGVLLMDSGAVEAVQTLKAAV